MIRHAFARLLMAKTSHQGEQDARGSGEQVRALTAKTTKALAGDRRYLDAGVCKEPSGTGRDASGESATPFAKAVDGNFNDNAGERRRTPAN